MRRKFLISLVGGGTVVVAVGGVGTHLPADTEPATSLDRSSTVRAGGHRALAGNIVAGRTLSKYHPLPRAGKKISDVSCPAGLKAVAGAGVTCTGKKSDGKGVDIPVTVVQATDSSVIWTFQR